MKIYLSSFLFFLHFVALQAQTIQATLEEPTTTGLHSILLSPNFRAAVQHHYDGIRLYDASQNEVPYVLRQGQNVSAVNVYRKVPMLSNVAVPKQHTAVVFENNQGRLQSLYLKIAAVAVEKKYTIKGSHEGEQWYGVLDHGRVSQMYSEKEPFVTVKFDFPVTTYKYLKFEFDDEKTVPIQVVEGTVLDKEIKTQTYLPLADYDITITENKATKTSKIHVRFDQLQEINKLDFQINSPENFYRKAKIITQKQKQSKNKTVTYDLVLHDFILQSNTENTIAPLAIFEREFWIEIENQDNPPLQMEQLALFQTPMYLIANLQKVETYSLISKKTSKAPQYDLDYFYKDFNIDLPQLDMNTVEILSEETALETIKPFWKSTLFLWAVILAAGIAVVFFALNLIKDLKKT